MVPNITINVFKKLLLNGNQSKLLCRFMSAKPNKPINGILPPIITPFLSTKFESVSLKHLENNFKKWKKINFSGYVLFGSNGEYPYLTDEERIDILNTVKKVIDKDKLLIVGTGYESLKKTIQTCEAIAKIGVDYALVITPNFYKNHMSSEALLNYYTKLADYSPIPILMYNMPANTGVDMSVELCCDLMHHPNIIGLKDSSGNIPKLATINEQVIANNREFYLLAGSAGFLLEALEVGCTGGICALANVLGDEVVEVYNLFKQGDHKSAFLLQKRLSEPNKAVTRLYGIPALKASMDANGYFGGPCRIPLLPLNENEYKHVKSSFINNGFQWIEN